MLTIGLAYHPDDFCILSDFHIRSIVTVPVRILIIDDAEEWRELLSVLVRKEQQFEVVGEADDGLVGVSMAEHTRPTVVVLDISMPQINGIETARRIRALSPETKLVFVSGEDDKEVVEEALRMGGSGYVNKPDVWWDLIAAIHAVLRGSVFVSPRLCSSDMT